VSGGAESACFAALQQRLWDAPLGPWDALGVEEECTVVGLPSTDFGPAFAERNDVPALEARWLYLLLLFARPHARVAIVTSEPVSEDVVAYYRSLIPDAPPVGDRLGLFSVADLGPRSLAEKLLDRPDVLAALQAFVAGRPRAFVHPFSALGAAERDVALRLDVPVLGIDARFARYGAKSGGRRLLAAAGVPIPDGEEDVRDLAGAARAIAALRSRRQVDEVVLKLDHGVTGGGNALIRLAGLPPAHAPAARGALEGRLLDLDPAIRAGLADGAVVEERVTGVAVVSPSVQARIVPGEPPEVVSTHDQILGGPLGHAYSGCRFPAAGAYAAALEPYALAVATRLADEGAAGRFALDFVVALGTGGEWRPYAVEINPREGATTHPHGTLALLGGTRAPAGEAGGARAAGHGGATHLRATDSLVVEGLRGTGWPAAVEALRAAGLAYDPQRGTGVILFMLEGIARTGRVSLTALGRGAEDAEDLYERAVDVLRATATPEPKTPAKGGTARHRPKHSEEARDEPTSFGDDLDVPPQPPAPRTLSVKQ